MNQQNCSNVKIIKNTSLFLKEKGGASGVSRPSRWSGLIESLKNNRHPAESNTTARMLRVQRNDMRYSSDTIFEPRRFVKGRKKGTKNGGVNRNRTDLSDFADRCLTSWLSRLVTKI